MRKVLAPLVVGIVFLMVPVLAIGASIIGSVQGFNCVTQGKLCPIGQEDPIIAAENVFVILVDAAKGDYYFVQNLDRGILARHINTQVKVDGDVSKKLKAIRASDLSVMAADKSWKKVWSQDKQDEIYRDLWNPSQHQ
jgi:hypothetical protein